MIRCIRQVLTLAQRKFPVRRRDDHRWGASDSSQSHISQSDWNVCYYCLTVWFLRTQGERHIHYVLLDNSRLPTAYCNEEDRDQSWLEVRNGYTVRLYSTADIFATENLLIIHQVAEVGRKLPWLFLRIELHAYIYGVLDGYGGRPQNYCKETLWRVEWDH